MVHATQMHGKNNQKEKEYLVGWQRAQADLENFRRRVSQQNTEEQLRTRKEVLHELLPLADNFQAIVEHLPENLKKDAWADGVIHVARQLQQLLENFNVVPMRAEGEAFDPSRHDAIGSVKQGKTKSGHVVEVVQEGYTFQGEVIRPAKVKVAQ